MTLPGLDDRQSTRPEQRLRDEQEIWITTIRSDGQPQASPVGFLWDGTSFLILTAPRSQKVRNLRGNPRVALHLDIDRQAEEGGGVLTLEGTARLDGDPMSDEEAATYAEKYADALRSAQMTAEEAFAELSAVIRVTPTRVRAY
jgi:PPOX class probable F420-dependent enzyme